jgi:ribosomal protein S18 acetylase RimI-like enzyme
VLAENHSAIRVYEALGFEVRASFETLIVQAPS